MALFREETEEARANAWLGRVLLARPVSFSLLTVASMVIVFVLACLFIAGEYTRKARVVGVLAPVNGIVKVVAAQGGVVEMVNVREGVLVEPGAPILTIADSRANEFESLGAAVATRLADRKHAL